MSCIKLTMLLQDVNIHVFLWILLVGWSWQYCIYTEQVWHNQIKNKFYDIGYYRWFCFTLTLAHHFGLFACNSYVRQTSLWFRSYRNAVNYTSGLSNMSSDVVSCTVMLINLLFDIRPIRKVETVEAIHFATLSAFHSQVKTRC